MKKLPPLIAALALTTLGSGCEKKDCLTKGYDATVQLIQAFNEGRCRAVFDADSRLVDCAGTRLFGEINAHTFSVDMEGDWGRYHLDDESLIATCGFKYEMIHDESTLQVIRSRFLEVLSDMDVD